jgi:hypothetical protein
LDNVRNWQSQYKPDSPEWKVAQAFIDQIKALMGHGKTLADLINAINTKVYADAHGDDIFMQFYGVSTAEVAKLVGYISDGHISLQPPSFTQMDTAYKAVEDWLAQKPPISDADKKLAQRLLQQMSLMGSNNSQIGPLKDWAQQFTADLLFAQASDAGKTLFCHITGATLPTGLAGWEQEIAAYLGQRTADYNTLLLELGIPPMPLPRTQAQWDTLMGFAGPFAQDMQRAQQTGDWVSLATKWNLPMGDIPTIQKEAQARLKGYRDAGQGLGDKSAITLFTEALTEIRNLEKSGGSLADLQKWAKGINLANFPGLSNTDKTEFQRLIAGNL